MIPTLQLGQFGRFSGATGATDSQFADVLFLMNDGSALTTDQSANGCTVTLGSTPPVIDTSIKPSGFPSSISFTSNANCWMQITGNTGYTNNTMQTGPFPGLCIEFWVYFPTNTQEGVMDWDMSDASSVKLALRREATNNRINMNGYGITTGGTNKDGWTAAGWHFLRIQASNANTYLSLNGGAGSVLALNSSCKAYNTFTFNLGRSIGSIDKAGTLKVAGVRVTKALRSSPSSAAFTLPSQDPWPTS